MPEKSKTPCPQNLPNEKFYILVVRPMTKPDKVQDSLPEKFPAPGFIELFYVASEEARAKSKTPCPQNAPRMDL